MGQPALAQERTFDVPEQPAVTGIPAFAKQAGIQIIAPASGLGDKKTRAVHGALSVDAALTKLLQGTGLQVASRNGAIVSLAVAPQTVPAPAQPQPMPTTSAVGVDNDSEAVETVVVTGTHIARPELESAMPISVIRTEDAKNFARNTVYDALVLNPAVGPGTGEMNSGGQVYEQGVANINLRNLGNNRSLVLVNGQRWVSSGARTSAVDLNTIPTALIDRVEVVTGGAAAIYGADAVSGAVNIIMKKEVSGLNVSATTGKSGEDDARQTNASLSTGFKFGDERGSFVIGVDYIDTTPIENLSRYPTHALYFPNPANTGPNDGIPDNMLVEDARQMHRSSVPTFCLPLGPGCQQWYQLINDVVTPVPQNSYGVILSGQTGTQDGGPDTSSTSFENVLLRPQSERASSYANVSYELTPDITWNTTLSYAHSDTKATPVWPAIRSDARPTNWWGGTTGEIATLTNPYLPSSLRQFMVDNNLTSIPLGRTYLNLPRAFEYHKRDNITVGTDISGKLSDKLNWQTYARYGVVTDDITTTNMVGKNEWLAGRNSILDPSTGQIVCADPVARANGCVPINFFSTAPLSQDVLNYIEHNRYEWTKNWLLNTGANISGSVFSLPYGDISVAAGIEWRRETLHTRDDPDTAKMSTIVYSGGLDYTLHPALDASRDTAEVYTEVVVPLLADKPFAKRLGVEGAYRFSHYSDSDNTNTWKFGGTWESITGLTFRGVYSRSVRVPNFGELFSPTTQSTFGNIEDPCQAGFITQNPNRAANCAAILPGLTLPLPRPNGNQPQIFGGGNPDLTPETSNSYTLGLVLQPTFLDDFDLTVDYWNIEIEDAITSLPYLNILNNCVDSEGGPNQAYCQIITRNALGEVASVQAQYANLSARSARGIDIGVNYRVPIGAGLFRVSLAGTHLLEQTIVAATGQPGIDYAGEWDFPTDKATLLTDFTVGKFTLGVNTRYISRSEYNVTAPSDETYEVSHIPSMIYNDVTLTFRPTDKYGVSVGAKNIGDKEVPVVLRNNFISPGAPSFRQDGAANYDAVGRYYFLKVDANF